MRFQRLPRSGDFQWTPRKEAATRRYLRKELERYPLFAEQIAAEQPTVEEIRRRRAAAWIESEQEGRKRRAEQWHDVRARLRLETSTRRAIIYEYWNAHRWLPGDPVYLMDLLRHPSEELQRLLDRPRSAAIGPLPPDPRPSVEGPAPNCAGSDASRQQEVRGTSEPAARTIDLDDFAGLQSKSHNYLIPAADFDPGADYRCGLSQRGAAVIWRVTRDLKVANDPRFPRGLYIRVAAGDYIASLDSRAVVPRGVPAEAVVRVWVR